MTSWNIESTEILARDQTEIHYGGSNDMQGTIGAAQTS